MNLQTRLIMAIGFVFFIAFVSLETITYKRMKEESIQYMYNSAEQIRHLLMATRRIYHKQFLSSGIALTPETLGFLPAHALSLISNDFSNWSNSGLSFNNVSDNPRNPNNAADEIEMEAIGFFLEHPEEEVRFVEFKNANGEPFYHYTRPIWTENYCLKCHGKREDAPPTIRETYATSYEYQVGDLRGIMSIKIPASETTIRLNTIFLHDSLLHLMTFFSVLLSTWLLVRRYFTQPLLTLNKGMRAISAGDFDKKLEGLEGDFAQIGQTFNTMGSEIIRNQSALRESEQRLRSILNNTQSVIFIKDLQGKYLLTNKKHAELFHIDSEEMIGKSDFDIFPTEAAKVFQENDHKVVEGNHPMEIEELVPHDDGVHTYFSVKFPLRNASGKIYAVCGISTDITKRKITERELYQAYENLKSSEFRHRSILENALDAIITFTKDGSIVEFNPAAEALFGHSAKEVVGQQVTDIITPVQQKSGHNETMVSFAKILEESPTKLRIEFSGKRTDGNIVDLEIGLTAIDSADNLIYTAFLHDITDRKQLLVSLRETLEVAESANKAKSEFLANISHEIRSPMNAIMGMTELVLATKLKEDQFENLKIVKNSAINLLGIINAILDYSKIEAGQLHLERIAFDLRDQVEKTCESLASLVHKKELDFFCNIAPGIPTLIGDPLRLNQVLMNLINNAIKFTNKGDIVVIVDMVHRDDIDKGIIPLHFLVADSGIGIAADRSKAIFEQFTQVDGSTTRKYGGTGLGLTISKHLVEMMGGRIWVESDGSSGSIFHFTANFETNHKIANPSDLIGSDANHKPQGSKHLAEVSLLLCDPNKTGGNIVEQMLRHFGAIVKKVKDLESMRAALLLAEQEQQPFAIMILDHQFPHKEIDAHTQKILRKSKKIIMLPVDMQTADLPEAFRFHDATVIKKPIKLYQLIKKVDQQLGRKTAKKNKSNQHLPGIASFCKEPSARKKSARPKQDHPTLSTIDTAPATLQASKLAFLEEAPKQVAQLRQELLAHKADSALKIVAWITEATANIGANRMKVQAIRLKGSIEIKQWEQSMQSLAKLDDALQKVIDILSEESA